MASRIGIVLGLLVLCAAVPWLYADLSEHPFLLDSRHVVESNLAIRNLSDPLSFFRDPGTFTSLRSNVDYRPLLTWSYALDAGGEVPRMPAFHRTQMLLHACVTVALFALAWRLASRAGRARGVAFATAFLSALVFAVHPAASGVVNYVSARSSLLTALWVLCALHAYLVPVDHPRAGKPAWLAALFLLLGLLSKVEAVACLGVFVLFDVWGQALAARQRRGFLVDLAAALRGPTWRRLWPALLVTAGYFVLRQQVMAPFDYADARQDAGVGPVAYGLTQVTALWHYVGRWFLCVELIADDGAYPVVQNVTDPAFLAAAGALALVVLALLACWRRRPELTVLGIASYALLSPTSSFLPLAEMVNEHRAYLPMGVLSIALTLLLVEGVSALSRSLAFRASAAGAAALLVAGLALATQERNQVFTSRERFWSDVLAKRPHHRAHLNYGRERMQAGDYEVALEHYERSLDTRPYWHVTHVNLGVVYQELGDRAKAREHFERAVDYDVFSGTALTHRGAFRLEEKDYVGAAEDFRASLPRSLEHFANWRGLAIAEAGLLQPEASFEAFQNCVRLDRDGATASILQVLGPFFVTTAQGAFSPERSRAGLAFLERLEPLYPDTWWIHRNRATLLDRLGEVERAAEELSRSLELQAAQQEDTAADEGS